MSKQVLSGLVVLVLIAVGIVWLVSRKTTEQAVSGPVLSVVAHNQTKNADASEIAAQPQDEIVYKLTAENKTDKIISGYIIKVDISDVADKGTLVDASGANYNSATNSLVWTPLDIPANESVQKQFTIRINSLSVNAADSVMKLKFNNDVTIALSAPKIAGVTTNSNPQSPVEPYKAPASGPAGNLSFWLATLATAAFYGVKQYRLLKT